MAKLGEVSEDIRELVDTILGETGLANYLNAEVMSISKQKQVVSVKRANATTEYLAKKPDSICIYVYEAVFDTLDDRQKDLIMRDAINQVYYDAEKDKIVITPPQINVTVGGRMKWGDELINAVETSVHAIEQFEEAEKERKKAEKESKIKTKQQF